MTFQKCQSLLVSFRTKQQTSRPLVRIDYGGTIYRGRVARSDSDSRTLQHSSSPYGVLVLENPGQARAPETVLQIADIPEDGLRPLDA